MAQVSVVLWRWWVDAWLGVIVEVQMAAWCGVEVCTVVDGVTCAHGGWRGPGDMTCMLVIVLVVRESGWMCLLQRRCDVESVFSWMQSYGLYLGCVIMVVQTGVILALRRRVKTLQRYEQWYQSQWQRARQERS